MFGALFSRIIVLVFGTLYPAYASYKTVRSKNVRQYVRWMMYWIVFALFSLVESFTDVFLSWLPMYYEMKALMVILLLPPVTRSSAFLYKKFVHSVLTEKEQEIDEYLEEAKVSGHTVTLQLAWKGVIYASGVIAQALARALNLAPATEELALIQDSQIDSITNQENEQELLQFSENGEEDDLQDIDSSFLPLDEGAAVASAESAQLSEEDDFFDAEELNNNNTETAKPVAPARKTRSRQSSTTLHSTSGTSVSVKVAGALAESSGAVTASEQNAI